jgi:hypothetical protein
MKKHLMVMLMILTFLLVFITQNVLPAPRGSLRIYLLDVEGEPLPGVTVTISSPDMMGPKSLTSDKEGEVLFINLFPAVYEIKSSLEGFQEVIFEDIRVSADKETTVKIEMEMAALKEAITVKADYPLVDTKRTTVSEYVTHDYVESLPVARDYVGYTQLVAGVDMVPNSGGRDTGNDPASKGGLNYYARGAQLGTRDNLYLLDGVNVTGLASEKAGMRFNNEVIQEQNVMTSGVPAEYGGGKGVVTNVVTKSGGNRFSGSVNLYLQQKSFWGDYKGLAAEDERLQGYRDNKYDTAFTFGGPIMKDKIWFFLSGQHRNDADTFRLSESASSIREEVDFTQNRYNGFGKLSFKISPRDSLKVTYFLDYFDTAGSRSKNLVKSRQPLSEMHHMAYNGHYQRVFSDNFIFDFRYGHYELQNDTMPRYPESGVFDTLQFIPGTHPRIEDYQFGAYQSEGHNKSTRDQFSFSVESYLGDMTLSAGLMYISEISKTDSAPYGGEQRYSLDPNLEGWTLWDVIQAGVWPYGEFRYTLLPYMNSNWDDTAAYYDSNGDGVLSQNELGNAVFSQNNQYGLNFWRWNLLRRGENKVSAIRWAGYIMDNWKISDHFTLNAGVRIENHNHKDSEGGTILHMPTIFLPRIGLAWDIGGEGRQKLTLFYGHYSDPMNFDLIHFAGNISGRVLEKQLWLANDWYTYRLYGSEENRDVFWAPNTKDNFAQEFSLTHELYLGNGLLVSSQVYHRRDRNIIEDIDIKLYAESLVGDPVWGHLALGWEDFGYPASGPPQEANFFVGNLIGAKRNIYGFDFQISKQFANGSRVVGQYSFKDARGNSTADKEALYQGDMAELDPRNPWMWGPLPGTIPHKIKLFGTYKTPIGINVGAMFYWNSGIIFTESYRRRDTFINWPLNDQWTELAKTGQERGPSWHQIDIKFNYILRFYKTMNIEIFLDIYNFTNNQEGYTVQYARNDPTWDYMDVTRTLNPRRIYLGARFRF